MKEVCGFLDKDGLFHKTKEQVDISNAKIRVRYLENFLENFGGEVARVVFIEQGTCGSIEEMEFLERAEQNVYLQVSKIILSNSKEWQKIIRQREEMSVELDVLKSNLKVKKWWLKFKWW